MDGILARATPILVLTGVIPLLIGHYIGRPRVLGLDQLRDGVAIGAVDAGAARWPEFLLGSALILALGGATLLRPSWSGRSGKAIALGAVFLALGGYVWQQTPDVNQRMLASALAQYDTQPPTSYPVSCSWWIGDTAGGWTLDGSQWTVHAVQPHDKFGVNTTCDGLVTYRGHHLQWEYTPGQGWGYYKPWTYAATGAWISTLENCSGVPAGASGPCRRRFDAYAMTSGRVLWSYECPARQYSDVSFGGGQYANVNETYPGHSLLIEAQCFSGGFVELDPLTGQIVHCFSYTTANTIGPRPVDCPASKFSRHENS